MRAICDNCGWYEDCDEEAWECLKCGSQDIAHEYTEEDFVDTEEEVSDV